MISSEWMVAWTICLRMYSKSKETCLSVLPSQSNPPDTISESSLSRRKTKSFRPSRLAYERPKSASRKLATCRFPDKAVNVAPQFEAASPRLSRTRRHPTLKAPWRGQTPRKGPLTGRLKRKAHLTSQRFRRCQVRPPKLRDRIQVENTLWWMRLTANN